VHRDRGELGELAGCSRARQNGQHLRCFPQPQGSGGAAVQTPMQSREPSPIPCQPAQRTRQWAVAGQRAEIRCDHALSRLLQQAARVPRLRRFHHRAQRHKHALRVCGDRGQAGQACLSRNIGAMVTRCLTKHPKLEPHGQVKVLRGPSPRRPPPPPPPPRGGASATPTFNHG
jgi:hypothetical protein